jgi:hypothetical protein
MPNIYSGYYPYAIGVCLMVLGLSFAYKFYLAAVLGRLSYWTGFLPITIVSPFLVHVPGSKRSLVRKTQGLWVHLLMGPVFLIVSALCLTAGAEFCGLPGLLTLNYILRGGDESKPYPVTFNKHTGFTFPLLEKSSKTIGERLNKAKIKDKDDYQTQVNPSGQSYNDAESGTHKY